MRSKFILPILLILASCTNNSQKQASSGKTSIYKTWQFKCIDTNRSHKTNHTEWIGSNVLDLTNKDTLKFSYGSIHNKPTAYPYKIQHDTIFTQNKPGYKILTLTDNELYLMAVFKNTTHQNRPVSDSIVMIYQAK